MSSEIDARTNGAIRSNATNWRAKHCAIYNLRDYGGYRTRHGELVRERLFRSGQHLGATSEDLKVISGLALASVIDLRNAAERRGAPCPRPPEFNAVYLHADDTDSELAPHLQAAERALNAEMARDTMKSLYREMPFRSYIKQVFRLYLLDLAEGRGPSLVHCAAGKDRTGLAVALVHLLLGVHPDDVMADYLLTNQMTDLNSRVEKASHRVRKLYGANSPDAAIRVVLSVESAFLAAGLGSIRDAHGSVAAYTEQILGFSPAAQGRLIQALHA